MRNLREINPMVVAEPPQERSEVKNQEDQEQRYFLKEKLKIIEEDLSQLTVILRERNHDQLYPLIYEDDIDLLAAAGREITEASSQEDLDFIELQKIFSRLSAALKGFGEPQPRIAFRDDAERIKQVDFSLGRISESLVDLKKQLIQLNEEDAQELANQTSKILDTLDLIGNFLSRKIQTMDDYLR